MRNEHEAVPLEQRAIPPIPREIQWQPLEGTWVEERRCGVERGPRRAGLRVRVFFDGTRANFGTIDQGAPPHERMPLPQLGYHPLPEVRKSNGRPLRTPPSADLRLS